MYMYVYLLAFPIIPYIYMYIVLQHGHTPLYTVPVLQHVLYSVSPRRNIKGGGVQQWCMMLAQ